MKWFTLLEIVEFTGDSDIAFCSVGVSGALAALGVVKLSLVQTVKFPGMIHFSSLEIGLFQHFPGQ